METSREFDRSAWSHYQLQLCPPGGGCGCSHPEALFTKITLPSGKTMLNTYDTEWRKTSVTVGVGTTDAATTSYGFDLVGNTTTVTDPLGKVWSNIYNTRNLLLGSTDPLNNTTNYSYDFAGNKHTVTRPDGGLTTNAYDSMNRLTQTTDPCNDITKFAYDNAGNLSSITDAKTNVYTYHYDLLNHRTSLVYPDGSHEDSLYDPVATCRSSQIALVRSTPTPTITATVAPRKLGPAERRR